MLYSIVLVEVDLCLKERICGVGGETESPRCILTKHTLEDTGVERGRRENQSMWKGRLCVGGGK